MYRAFSSGRNRNHTNKLKKKTLMKSGNNNILPSGRQKVRATSLETVILKYLLNEHHSADADHCSSQMSGAEGLLG